METEIEIQDKTYNVEFYGDYNNLKVVECRWDEWPGHSYVDNLSLVIEKVTDIDTGIQVMDKSVLASIEKIINDDEDCLAGISEQILEG